MTEKILYNNTTKTTKIFNEEYDVVYSGNIRGVTRIYGQSIIYSGVEEYLQSKLEQFLKMLLQQEITMMVKKYTDLLRIKYNKITVRKTRTRWGSCSHQGNLSFNLYLIVLPYHIVEYVVVHEICHLIEMNHSKRFWSLVKQLYPQYQEARHYLRAIVKNGCIKF